MLPLATVFRTGNHIADLDDGGQRRRCAKKLCEQVDKALNHRAPWAPAPVPDENELAKWLARLTGSFGL